MSSEERRYVGVSRTEDTAPGSNLEPTGRKSLFNKIYLGFVKDTKDIQRMGRLKVYIPELGGNETDPKRWYTVSYASPFAGATNVKLNKKDGKTMYDTQMSYGMWMVPPDIDNEVIVAFINGDPSRGIWLGCLYQQMMTHSIPGYAINQSWPGQEGGCNIPPPVTEYNKWDSEVQPDDPPRPRFDPLHEGLCSQGLYVDPDRGVTDASARREAPSQVYGLRSPRGHQVYIDDGEIETDEQGNPVYENNEIKKKFNANEYIRFRTRSGAQVLINDTLGYIYMITKKGNSWAELSDDGINVYSSKNINFRTQSDFNLRVDGNFNLEVLKDINTNVLGNYNITNGGAFNLKNSKGVFITTDNDYNLKASSDIKVKTDGSYGETAGGEIVEQAGTIHNNTKTPPSPSDAFELKPRNVRDRALQPCCYPVKTASSIINSPSFVTHEPWAYHKVVKNTDEFSTITHNCSPTMPVTTGSGEEVEVPMEDDALNIDPVPGSFIVPMSGRVTSLFGLRNHPIQGGRRPHRGVDIAAGTGTAVAAAADGVVRSAQTQTGYGKTIVIDHNGGYVTLYAHLSQYNVSPGTKVKQGQTIGACGNTGVSSGPHLHFEIIQGSSIFGSGANKQDPGQYIPALSNLGGVSRGTAGIEVDGLGTAESDGSSSGLLS